MAVPVANTVVCVSVARNVPYVTCTRLYGIKVFKSHGGIPEALRGELVAWGTLHVSRCTSVFRGVLAIKALRSLVPYSYRQGLPVRCAMGSRQWQCIYWYRVFWYRGRRP